MASASLVIVGEGSTLRQMRPTVVTDIQSATAASVDGFSEVTVKNNRSAQPTLSTSLSSHHQLRLSVASDDRRQTFRTRGFPSNTARNGTDSPTVVLLCSGKNILETPGSVSPTVRHSMDKINHSDAADLVLPHASGIANDDAADPTTSMRRSSNQRHRHLSGSSSTVQSAHDAGVFNLQSFRPVVGCWVNREPGGSYANIVDGKLRQSSKRNTRTMATVAAEAAARRHIWACQQPGSIKRSSRVSSDLLNMMEALSERNRPNSSSSLNNFNASFTMKTEGSENEFMTGCSTSELSASHGTGVRLSLPSSSATSSNGDRRFDDRWSGSSRKTTSAGRRSTSTVRGLPPGRRQASPSSSLSAADIQPFLCITSIDAAMTRAGSTRVAVDSVSSQEKH